MSSTWRDIVEHCRDDWGKPGTYAVPYTECGDYVGSLYYKANAKVILEECGLVTYEAGGMYRTDWVETSREYVLDAIRVCRQTGRNPREIVEQLRHLLECLDASSGYPVLDESVWSELEFEALGETLDDLRRYMPMDRDLSESARDRWDAMSEAEQAAAHDKAAEYILEQSLYTPEYNYVYVSESDYLDGLGLGNA